MGKLTRNQNWSTTSLGTPDQWPQSLRTTVSIILNSRFPMFLFWGPELLCFYNDAFRPSLGNGGKHPDALGRPAIEVWPETWDTIKPLIDQVLAGGDASWNEDQLLPIYRNGQLEDVYWTFSYSPVSDESGEPAGVLVTCSENTNKIKNINQLRISEQRFQNLMREASVGIIVLIGEELRVDVVNRVYAQLIERSRDELLNKPIFSIIPESEEVFRPIIEQVRQTGDSLYLYDQPYFVNVGSNRKEGFLNLVYQPYRELNGEISGVMVLCQDVTAQVKSKQQVKRSEAKLRSLVESAPFPIGVYVGPDMVIEFANQSILDVWGKGNNVIGKSYAAILPELATQEIFDQLSSVYTTGVAFHANNQRVDIVVDGKLQPYYFKYSFTPLFDETGKVYGVMNTGAEVTDLVMARQRQTEAEESLRGAIELAQLATWSLDIKAQTFTYSERFMQWLGFSDDTKSIDDAFDPVPETHRVAVADAVAAAVRPGSSGLYNNEHPIVNRLTGQQRIIHVHAQVSYSVTGEPLLLSGTAQDVTEQRMIQLTLEQQVQQRTEELAAANEELAATNEELAATNEELESSNEEYAAINEELTESTDLLLRSNDNLQRFAYIASHDLQEPLRKVQQFGDLLRAGYGDQLSDGIEYLTRMQSAASRMSTLIKDLLTFSRIATRQDAHELVSLTELVRQTIDDLDLVITESGAVVTVDPLPTVVGDAGQLSQLFTNLLSNGLKFRRTDELGKLVPPQIRFSSRLVLAHELPPGVKPTRMASKYNRIDVADNGIGFDEKYLDRIFQVFQRLHGKNEFAGTGIGLAICEKVVANHGGAITAASQLGEGATFSVYLPV
uniref:PAS domain-containing protein n=1 Tax=Spirosoma rigui TaxID=564064 RepID=UPI0009AF805B